MAFFIFCQWCRKERRRFYQQVRLVNGLCDGSRDGWCEVFPGKKRYIYVRAYGRLRAYREEGSMKDGYIPPRNWDLGGISSWANYFLSRDHQAVE
jgi:methylenetetrahydrofolate reductase (NADPH)